MMDSLAIPFVVALALTLGLVPLCRALSFRVGCVTYPTKDRWHSTPTAFLGGVAVAVVTLGTTVIFVGLTPLWPLIASAGLIFGVGLTDDVLPLKPSTKLVAEIALASGIVYAGYRLEWTQSLTVDALLTLLWIVGITNAFNLLDHMDGLCAGVALIAGASLIAMIGGEGASSAEATYLVILLGVTAGFLVYNFNPARIFLGDSGSLFIGFSLACLTLMLGRDGTTTREVLPIVAAPAFVLLVPIFDTTLVTLSRLLTGRLPSAGGRDHSTHRLVAIGLSERRAVGVLWSLAAVSGLVGVTVRQVSPEWSWLAAALLLVAMAIFAVYLSRVKVYENVEDSAPSRSRSLTWLVADVMYKRRAAEVLLDVGLISIAYYAAYRLRFEGNEWTQAFPTFIESLPIIVGVQMVTLFVVGVYRGVWRHFSLMDAVVFAKSVLVGSLCIVAAVFYLGQLESFSRSVFLIYGTLLMLLLTGSRASFRLINEFVRRRRADGDRLAIYGAGEGGQAALRELVTRYDVAYRIVGFVDDDPNTHGTRVHGYRVLGGYNVLAFLVENGEVDGVVVSTELVSAARLVELEQLCEARNVALSRLHIEFQRLVPRGQADLSARRVDR